VKLVRRIADLRSELDRMRTTAGTLAFVPTMGALHAGHASLVERAHGDAGAVVVSVFVNPLQFGPAEDFEAYPRDLERDAAALAEWGTALLFAPEARELLPRRPEVTVDPGPLGARLEGAVRPGHFRGVLTIVAKLLHLVEPDVAVFGQKDLQQAVLVRRMAADLDLPVRIAVAPTVREPDGLALSSRNAYLSPSERAAAPALIRSLRAGERALLAGERRARAVRQAVLEALAEEPSLQLDYAAVLRADDLAEVEEITGPAAIAAAARLGRIRLLDNLLVDPEGSRG
jgi:pantoate--beta-alanine ligase